MNTDKKENGALSPPFKGIDRLKSGISGLDEVLEGGLPKGRSLLVTGTTGAGKTVFLNEFLYRGMTRFDEGGVFITFEERPDDIIRNVWSFGWDYGALIQKNKLNIMDCSQRQPLTIRSGEFDWDALIFRMENAIQKVSAGRVVLDSIASAFHRHGDWAGENRVRDLLFMIMDRLKELRVTAMITAEKTEQDTQLSRFGFEEFVSDGVLNLRTESSRGKTVRNLEVVKLRGLSYRTGKVEFEITEQGVAVFPKIPVDTNLAETDFDNRKPLGIDVLDRAMDGGIPEGHMMLVTGNTGTGKTLFGMHFLTHGIEAGEKGLWVALEEPVPQVKKTGDAHGWDLDKFEKEAQLRFIRAELLDISPDKLLYQILRTSVDEGIKRVVIDSVSSLESATMDRNKVRDFLIQLSTFFKRRGITCIMNYLCAESFGASENQLLGTLSTNEMRLSSIVDGIVMLRYVERDQEVRKLMNILKLRGSAHDRDILQYEIAKGGIQMGARFGG